MTSAEALPRPAYGLRIGDVDMGDTDLWTYVVKDVRGLGKPETTTADRGRPREDGEYFGRDRMRGRKLVITGYVNTYSRHEAREAWRRLVAAWSAPDVRGIPGMAIPLELTLYDGEPVTVFGRPRSIDPTDDADFEAGVVPFAAQFDCIDHLFYSREQSTTIPIVAGAASGITWPVRWPLRWVARSDSALAGQIEVGGTVGSWLQATVFAPGGMVRPVIALADGWTIELNLTIPPDATPRFVTVIAAPWARSVLLDGITDVASTLTPASGLLRYARIPPGPQQIQLRGTDDTGTAWMALSWRDAAETV